MNKKTILDYIIVGSLFTLLTVALVLVPTEKTVAFWITYGFTAVAFAAIIYIVGRSKGKASFISTRFLGLPLLQLGMLYAVAQIVFLAAFAVEPNISIWAAIIGCILILLFFGYFILTANYDYVEDAEPEDANANKHGDRAKAFSLDQLYDDVKKCSEKISDEETKDELRKLCSKINLASSVRSAETLGLEKRIQSKVETLKTADNKLILIEEISDLLDERDEICNSL